LGPVAKYLGPVAKSFGPVAESVGPAAIVLLRPVANAKNNQKLDL
jgi:hypothetical protein